MCTQLRTMFTFLDAEGVGGRTASAELVLGNGDIMTVRAGGPGIHSGPSFSPFKDYEVLLDHEPARFWTRYTDAVGMVYAHIPRILLVHHVTRRGGISQLATESYLRHSTVMLNVQFEVPRETCGTAVDTMLSRVKDARLVSTHVVAL